MMSSWSEKMGVKAIFSLLCISVILVGCSDPSTSKALSFSHPASHEVDQLQSTATLDDTNQPQWVGDWSITMKPMENDPTSADFVDYKFECFYWGNASIQNATIQAGNGKATLKDIKYGEGGVLGSSFNRGTKEIDLTISFVDDKGNGMAKFLRFHTGQ